MNYAGFPPLGRAVQSQCFPSFTRKSEQIFNSLRRRSRHYPSTVVLTSPCLTSVLHLSQHLLLSDWHMHLIARQTTSPTPTSSIPNPTRLSTILPSGLGASHIIHETPIPVTALEPTTSISFEGRESVTSCPLDDHGLYHTGNWGSGRLRIRDWMMWGKGSVCCDGSDKCWCGCWLLFFGSLCVESWDDTKVAIRFLCMGSSKDDCGCSFILDGELGFWKGDWGD